ncbi:hypothetical protein [Rhodohalobacter mucosus]|uniref:PorV/PorQ family protein n=1 Tax=Rhodohalobacter mucosus TaxID=2079485 RepID=A0A316TUG0_9BACT|nr:hypothetical protein [Rhodohalobacter mucosus]PWN08070.1 hypothetical protein DDZ15_00075 [Rhodohalobacter mucosus]
MNVNVHAGISAILWTVLLFFTAEGTVYSQFSMGAAPATMGHTGTALKHSSWAVFNNPAWISTKEQTVSFFAYRFSGLHELTDMAASVTIHVPFGAAAAGVHRFGFDLYSEQRIAAAFKKELGALHAGVSVVYHHVSIGGGYGTAGTTGVLAGIGIELTEQLQIAGRTGYLNRPELGSSNEPVYASTAAGIRYSVSERAYITADFVKDPDFPLSARAGIEFRLIESLTVRSGLSGRPSSYGFGFGYDPGPIRVNMGVQQNQPLGMSAAMDLIVPF